VRHTRPDQHRRLRGSAASGARRSEAGLAFIVSAVALIGSAAFPLVIEKLKENEGS